MGTRTATFSREIAVAGAGMCPFGAFSDKTSRDLFVEAHQEMEKSVDKGFDPEVIDAIYVGNSSSDIFEGKRDPIAHEIRDQGQRVSRFRSLDGGCPRADPSPRCR